MKRLLTTLGIAALLACAPAASAQATRADATDTKAAVTSGDPADNIIPIYPEKDTPKKYTLNGAPTYELKTTGSNATTAE